MPDPEALRIARGVAAQFAVAPLRVVPDHGEEPPPHDAWPDGADAEPDHGEPTREPDVTTGPAAGKTGTEETKKSTREAISPTPFVLRHPAEIQPREWLYGNHYIRKFVTATIAPGGMGKSSLALAEAVAMCTGKNLLGFPVRKPLRVWYWGGEDPISETERRIAAICLHYGISAEEIEGRLFFDSGRDLEIRLATMVKQQAAIDTALVDTLANALRAVEADVMMIDPFVASHGLPENDNTNIDWVLKAGWVPIADRANAAVELVHHVRKSTGGQTEFTVDDARGASSAMGAVRSARVLNLMTTEQASTGSVPVDERWQYFRVETGKTNMTARGGKPHWYRLRSVGLGNSRGDWPEDLVGVVTPWSMPGVFDNIQTDDVKKVQDKIAKGSWGANSQAGDWAGHAVGEALDISTSDDTGKAKVKGLLAAWIKSGALRQEHRHCTRAGKQRPFIVAGVSQ
jgi:hypothetical protein